MHCMRPPCPYSIACAGTRKMLALCGELRLARSTGSCGLQLLHATCMRGEPRRSQSHPIRDGCPYIRPPERPPAPFCP